MDTDLPLSDEELDELDAFLMAEGMPEEAMDVAMLDGFFTALAIGPNTLLPSRWLPLVWGETESEPMQFADDVQVQRILGLVMRMYNDRIQSLEAEVADVKRQIADLQQQFADFKKQFE